MSIDLHRTEAHDVIRHEIRILAHAAVRPEMQAQFAYGCAYLAWQIGLISDDEYRRYGADILEGGQGGGAAVPPELVADVARASANAGGGQAGRGR